MASRNFNNLRQRTLKIYNRLTRSSKKEMLDSISSCVVGLEDVNEQVKSLHKKAKENRTLINTILNALKKKKKPKFGELVDPFARFFFKKKKDDSKNKKDGALGWLMGLGLGELVRKMIRKYISNRIKRLFKKAFNKIKRGAIRIARKGKEFAKAAWEKAARYGKDLSRKAWRSTTRYASRAVTALRPLAMQAGRIAIRGAAGVAVGALAGTIGYPLMIAAAAAAVGFGAYKLGRYLKLSEKLDEFIKKVSGGKYKDIVDFIMGVGDGSIGKELYGWVKDKIGSLFDDAITYLKLKTNDILGSLSPFANDPTIREGEDPSENKENNRVTNNDNSSDEGALDSANDNFQSQMRGTATGAAMDPSVAISGDDSAYYESNVSGGDTAWQKLTGGKATKLNSGFGKRDAPLSGASTDHKGIDIKAGIGTPIYALENGTFSFSGSANSKKGGGLSGYLKSDSGLQYGFAHLSRIKAASGPVKKGQLIALSGNSGNSTGPHIHFSIKNKSGAYINPTNVAVPTNLTKPSAEPSKQQAKPSATGVVNSVLNAAANGIGSDTPNSSEYSDYAAQSINTIKPVASSPIIASQKAENSSYVNDTQQTTSQQMQNMVARTQAPAAVPSASTSATSSHIGNTSTASVKDPRGALNMDIVLAATSPLFV